MFCRLPRMEAIATLDLRIDYLKPATIGEDLFARAECYRLTRQIAFVRSVAYQRDPQQPVVARLKDLAAQYPGSEIKITACERAS